MTLQDEHQARVAEAVHVSARREAGVDEILRRLPVPTQKSHETSVPAIGDVAARLANPMRRRLARRPAGPRPSRRPAPRCAQNRKPSVIWAESRDGAENPMITGGAQYSLS